MSGGAIARLLAGGAFGARGVSLPLRVFRPFLRRFRWAIALVALLSVIAGFLEGVGIGVLVPLLTLLLADTAPAGLPAPVYRIIDLTQGLTPAARLAMIGAAVLAIIAVKGAMQVARAWISGAIASQVGHDLRKALAERMLALSYPLFMTQDPVRFIDVIAGDSWEAIRGLKQMLEMIGAFASLAIFAAMLLWLDWRLFAIAAAIAVVAALLLYGVTVHLRRLGIEVTESNHDLAQRMATIVAALRVIRVFGRQDAERRRFGDASRRADLALQAVQRATGLVLPMVEFVVSAGLLAVMLAGVALALPIGLLAAFVILLARALPYARELSEARLGLAALQGAFAQVDWLLSLSDEAGPAPTELPPALINEPIAFDRVTYTYPNGRRGLIDGSFTVRPGVCTALIGESGAGKSTIVNLLARFIEPETGAIRLGARDLATIGRDDWRARIAIAGQDLELVDGSIADNIAYGNAHVGRAEIEQIARETGVDAFVSGFADGYDTPVTRDGVNLSGGQRQRIGLARALIKNADLLILDEATSAVDGLTEREILVLLNERRHFRTAIVISHRISALAACEDGVVLKEGRVVEAGPLRSLDYLRDMTTDRLGLDEDAQR
jgi:subfamily B ATP-binding cassette protein MsbA